MGRDLKGRVALTALALAVASVTTPAAAQDSRISVAEGVHAGEVAVPVNKSQVIRSDRPYAKALIGAPDIADVLPLTDQSLYVLGKKAGTTSLTLYDRNNMLIAVVDVVVGPDVISLRRQLSELMPGDSVGARISNDSIVLEGVVPNAVAADRAVQIAETYAPGKVVNMLSMGSSQQVMLEVRFSEIKRSALKQIGVGIGGLSGSGNNGLTGVIGGGASLTPGVPITSTVNGVTQTVPGDPIYSLGSIIDSFGIISRNFSILGLSFQATLDALERKGLVNTLAEPTLVALSGETASFLAGGEFPVPVVQNSGGGGGSNGSASSAITVEWKPFGVSLAFTPTVLADGVISMVVAPEVSSIDQSASIVINNLRIPGVQTRRAKTTVELRDGESFALAGLIRNDFQDTVRQFPILGSLPIIGSLFRSTGFQRDETELVMIVTPRLVKPVRAGSMKVPTDRVQQPNEADLFLLGRTDTGVAPIQELGPQQTRTPPPSPPAAPGGSAAKKPVGFEKEYGHVL
ncbi:type II and III secretion system protein family protein [Sphingomonas daechungensis]|uniref:Type II and III secretion system protein family protein n=1 Tax=Sphingomonas daechungensis TaxID=1176646 RepID=A0ABX6T2Z7_9SPHN|nr:type II and III secretion system protein family protein [Sphingomonas daechungensis]QNP43073.1 type II and III secretion system protein family protein [Sphingomonas daechungensis]